MILGFGWWWRFLTGVLDLDVDFDMVISLWYTHVQNCGSLSWFWRCKEHLCPLSPHFGLLRTLKVSEWGLASWSWFGFGHWFFIQPWYEFWLSILILKVQRTYMSFKSSFEALADSGCFWMGFGILILIWKGSVVFDTSLIHISALYLDFEDAKYIHVL